VGIVRAPKSSKRGTYAFGAKGVKVIERNLAYNIKIMKHNGYIALTKGAVSILKESRRNTPIDTGDLIGSSTLLPAVTRSGEVKLGVAYLSKHAAAVHETHPNATSSMTVFGKGKNTWPRGRHYLARAMEAKRKSLHTTIQASMSMKSGKLRKSSRSIVVGLKEES
jgi:hypothetical protein